MKISHNTAEMLCVIAWLYAAVSGLVAIMLHWKVTFVVCLVLMNIIVACLLMLKTKGDRYP